MHTDLCSASTCNLDWKMIPSFHKQTIWLPFNIVGDKLHSGDNYNLIDGIIINDGWNFVSNWRSNLPPIATVVIKFFS